MVAGEPRGGPQGRRDAYAPSTAAEAAELRGFTVTEWLTAWADSFSAADRVSLDDETAGYLLGNIQEALKPGIDGWIDDKMAWAWPEPWGFDLESIRQPVAIWHGAEDWMVHPIHARWLADRLPSAQVHIVDGDGHPSLIFRHVDGVMDWIAAVAGTNL